MKFNHFRIASFGLNIKPNVLMFHVLVRNQYSIFWMLNKLTLLLNKFLSNLYTKKLNTLLNKYMKIEIFII